MTNLPKDPKVYVPLLMIWGRQDQALSERMVQPSLDLCPNSQLLVIDEATHWVQHDAPNKFSQAIIRFLE